MKRRKNSRDVSGILLLNKEYGMSSTQALIMARGIFSAAKAGHTGALDPLASGLLPICFGEASKFSSFFLEGQKKYITKGKLGVTTTSCDGEGEVVLTRPVNDAYDKIESVLESFRGTITQVPPIYSAIKVDGRPLYKYARAGIEIEIPKREVQILDLKLLDIDKDDETMTLEVTCSKGTYIRTLVSDIGEMLGCGAYVTYLHRVWVQGLPENQMVTLDELQKIKDNRENKDDFSELDKYLYKVDDAMSSLPLVNLSKAKALTYQYGVRQGPNFDDCDFDKSLIEQEDVDVQVRYQGKFFGVASFKKGMLISKRMMSNVKLDEFGNNID